jgi:DNA-directed RNA polymerase subunit RPC12/RpoP
MAKNMGHCKECGQNFKRARISGRRKGYQVLNKGKHSTRIQCKGCGRKITVRG